MAEATISSKRQKLIDTIKLLLGGGVLSLEVTDQDISNLIDLSVMKISPYCDDRSLIQMPASPVMELPSDVVEVIRVYESPDYSVGIDFDETKVQVIDPNNLLNMQVLGMKKSELDYLLDKEFKFIDHKLYLDDYYGTVSIEVCREITLESMQDERCYNWVIDYSIASCKEVVGRIRSKFRPSDVPVELDGDTLLSEAISAKERLESDIHDQGYGLFFARR